MLRFCWCTIMPLIPLVYNHAINSPECYCHIICFQKHSCKDSDERNQNRLLIPKNENQLTLKKFSYNFTPTIISNSHFIDQIMYSCGSHNLVVVEVIIWQSPTVLVNGQILCSLLQCKGLRNIKTQKKG